MNSIVHAVLTSYASGGVLIDPRDPLNESVGGGCRTAFIGIVKELGKLGHTVRAFSTFKERATINNIQYLPIEELDNHGSPNIMWACYDTRPLHGRSGMLRIGSHHTYLQGVQPPFDYIDINTIPSQSALDLLKAFWAPHSTWKVLPNAVNDVPIWNPIPGRVVYHTSPDRGLHFLIQIWPEIKSRVPEATLHIIGNHEKWINETLSYGGMENSEIAKRAKKLRDNFEIANKVGGITCLSNLPRHELLRELSQASVFAFPCSVVYPTETFSVSIMECCKIGVPVVLAPQDALESIYKGHVIMTQSPIEDNLHKFTNSVVYALQDQDLAQHYSKLGKELASNYTYERSGKVLSDIICENTGFTIKSEPETYEYTPVNAPKSSKKMAFLLDPWACPRPINPEIAFTDARGLTGSEVTNLMQAIEAAKHGYDVTMYSNFTHESETFGIKFAQWSKWPEDSKKNWYSAFATIHPAGLQNLKPGTLRILNQQVNDFGYCSGWEQYTDIVTALSHAHQKHLSQFTNFKNWIVLPNGCNPAEYHDGPRNNKKLVFASSPDRGLHWLLELFPRLKKRVPDAECHVYYNYQDNAVQAYKDRGEDELSNRFKYIDSVLPKLSKIGVFHHKSASRQEMARVFSEYRILAYTCDPVRFTEGFSCTTLEAAVAGCLPVICGTDALGEIYGSIVPTTPPPYIANKDHYFDNLVKYLINDDEYMVAQNRAKEMAKTHNWAAVSKQLQTIMKL